MIRRNIVNDPATATQFVAGMRRLKDPAVAPWAGNPGLAMYDFFVFWHHRAMMLATPPSQSRRNAAHSGPVFLPWHRYMLLMLEFYLRDTLEDDEFRLPYWDWTGDADLVNPEVAPVWSAEILGAFTGDDWRVRLEENPFSPTNALRVLDPGRPLVREFASGVGLPDLDEVRDLVARRALYDTADYDDGVFAFRNRLEGWLDASGQRGASLHNRVHVWVGGQTGDMSASTSPNDPTFFLHHCNVDRIWAAWQQAHPDAEYRPGPDASDDLRFHRLDDPMHTFFDHEVTPRLMLDHTPWYTYDDVSDLLP